MLDFIIAIVCLLCVGFLSCLGLLKGFKHELDFESRYKKLTKEFQSGSMFKTRLYQEASDVASNVLSKEQLKIFNEEYMKTESFSKSFKKAKKK